MRILKDYTDSKELNMTAVDANECGYLCIEVSDVTNLSDYSQSFVLQKLRNRAMNFNCVSKSSNFVQKHF